MDKVLFSCYSITCSLDAYFDFCVADIFITFYAYKNICFRSLAMNEFSVYYYYYYYYLHDG